MVHEDIALLLVDMGGLYKVRVVPWKRYDIRM